MKKHILLLSALTIFITSCGKNTSSSRLATISSQEIETVANDFFTALGSGDSTLMRRLLTEDFEMYEHDQVWNIDSLLSLMPNTLGRKWSIVDPVIHTEGLTGHIYYFNQGINPSDRSWYESMLLEKDGGNLRIKFMQSTKLYLK